jgi:2-dehydro-3-deoxygluconokinase
VLEGRVVDRDDRAEEAVADEPDAAAHGVTDRRAEQPVRHGLEPPVERFVGDPGHGSGVDPAGGLPHKLTSLRMLQRTLHNVMQLCVASGSSAGQRRGGGAAVSGAVCIGESMALLVPGEPGPPEQVRTWVRSVGGAESNVACNLVQLGVPARWVSAVGDDPFGRAVVGEVGAAGVDVSGVRMDPARPTGLYVKESNASGSPVRYYRTGSAASALEPSLLSTLDLADVQLVHVSGITPALSDSCLELMRRLVTEPRSHLLSFDVNWRPALWTGRSPDVLTSLANAADVVLVGDDEAEAVFGTGDPARIREILPGPRTLVVKHGARGASLLEGACVFEPALRVGVVEPVGAGDAFAAGFLAATLAGWDPVRRLRSGHLQAATALLTHDDVGVPLPASVVASLLEADAATWAEAWLS